MKRVWVAVVLILFGSASGACAAVTKFQWSISPPGCSFEMTVAIEPLEHGPADRTPSEIVFGVSPERRFGHFADVGMPLFRRIHDLENSMVWFLGSIEPDTAEGFYLGELDSLTILLDDGSSRQVREIIGSVLTDLQAPIVWLLPRRGAVRYRSLLCEIRGKQVRYVFLGFPATFDPSSVVGIRVKGRAL